MYLLPCPRCNQPPAPCHHRCQGDDMKGRNKPPPKAQVLVLAPLKPAASPKPNLADEEHSFTAHYLRLADTALKDGASTKVQAISALGGAMDQTKVKVTKYDPLTFACIVCDRQFLAGDKDLAQLSREVTEHILRDHPEQASQQRAA